VLSDLHYEKVGF
jgi:hypothetical protein